MVFKRFKRILRRKGRARRYWGVKRALAKRRNTGAIGRSPKVVNWTRERWQTINIADPSFDEMGFMGMFNGQLVSDMQDDVYNRLNLNLVTALGNIPQYQEFTSLYSHYKINAISVSLFPSYPLPMTMGTQNLGNAAQESPPSLIIFAMQNQDGDNTLLGHSILDYEQIIRKRTQLFPRNASLNKPLTFYSKTKVASLVFGGSEENPVDYRISRPQWMSVLDTETPNYSLHLSLATATGAALSALTVNKMYTFQMRVRFYFSTRYVQ